MRYWDGRPLKNRVSLAKYGAPNFYLDEFFHPDWYLRPGNSTENMIEMLQRSRLHQLAQIIRYYFDCPCIINTWAKRGSTGRVDSGLRTRKSVGAEFSWHLLFGAIDIQVIRGGVRQMSSVLIDEIFSDVEFKDYLYDFGVREIEDPSIAKTWLHISLLGTDRGYIKIIGK